MITPFKDDYIALGDLHLLASNPVCRKDDLTITQWMKLRFVFEYALRRHADILLAGDLGNISNDYSVLNKFTRLLKEYKDKGAEVFAVFGQHDLKYRNREDTNLDILISTGLITLLGDRPISRHGSLDYSIYGVGWNDPVPVIPSSESSRGDSILVIHAPISPVALFAGQNYIDTRDFQKEHPGFSIVICGDVHRTFMEKEGNTIFLNSGPMVRKEADEYNLVHKPGFYFIDIKKQDIKYVEIPHKPSSEVITVQHIERKKRKVETAARADTSQFLHELQERTNRNDKESMDLKDRLIQRIRSEKGKVSKGSAAVIETLLNTGEVSQY